LAREGHYQYYYMGKRLAVLHDLINYLLIHAGYYIPSCIKMRYKGSFWPTYLLGRMVTWQMRMLCLHDPDPESLHWNLLDKDLQEKLDRNHYFSPSASNERKESNLKTNGATQSDAPPKDPKPESEIDYTSLEIDSENDSADETEIPEGSLFDYHVPGILTKEEVEEKLDLDHWKLVVRNMFVDMEDLNGWGTGNMTDPQSVKGIVAELAAALGPEVVKGGSAVNLF
jgi:arginyl-tRNA---protein transferase